MAITNGPLGDGVIVHLICCLLFGVIGISNNALILRYFTKKQKLDQLSILYTVISVISLLLSSVHIIQFIFFYIPGIYYNYTIDAYCQSNAAIFFAAVAKILYMTGIRSALFIITLLIFLTTSKVKWKIFKIQTRMMKYMMTMGPGVLLVIMVINCFVELKCTAPFFLPWLGVTDAMTIIYFWLLLVLPTILSVACVVALFTVVLGGEVEAMPQKEAPEPEPVPQPSKDVKVEVGGITKKGSLKAPKKLEMVKQKVHSGKETLSTKFSERKAKIGNKFKNREVTKRTIITVMILGGITVLTIIPSLVVTLKKIYSEENLLVYNAKHTTRHFNIAYIFSTLLPSLNFVIIIPIVMMKRVTGINRYIHKKMGNVTTKTDQ